MLPRFSPFARRLHLALLGTLALGPLSLLAADEQGFSRTVQPFLQRYCYECHNATTKKGGVDLEMFSSAAIFEQHPTKLDNTILVIEDGDMPPKGAALQPSETEKRSVVAWLTGELSRQQNVVANDPGPVVMPRINHKEYDYVVRDLTGKALAMGQFLTADTGGGEGFLNVGAALPMQVGNFEGFLATGKKLLGHARITPRSGITWFDAPQPPAETTDALSQALLVCYRDWFEKNHSQEYARQAAEAKARKVEIGLLYMEAAWRYQHRAALGMPHATFRDIADAFQPQLYPDAVAKTYGLLTRQPETMKLFEHLYENPLFAEFLGMVAGAPAPRSRDDLDAVQPALAAAGAFSRKVQSHDGDFGGRMGPFEIPWADKAESQQYRGNFHRGRQPYRLGLSKVKGRELYLLVTSTWDGTDGDRIRWKAGELTLADGRKVPWSDRVTAFTDPSGATVPLGPDGEVTMGSGTWLRFPVPTGATRLDLWAEFDSIKGGHSTVQTEILDKAPAPEQLVAVTGRPILGQALQKSSPKIRRAKTAIEHFRSWSDGFVGNRKMRSEVVNGGLPPEARTFYGITESPKKWSNWTLFSVTRDDVIHRSSAEQQAELRAIEAALLDHAATGAAPAGQFEREARETLGRFAGRAWRQAPPASELEELVALFRAEAEKGLPYEAALKVPLAAVLVSAPFLYRVTTSRGSDEPYPLQDAELATRLAFFLWASLPDQTLLDLAVRGQLHKPETLRAQVRRMLADDRANGFVEQFLGIWLTFADFDTFSGPDAMKFAGFNDPLKKAMHDEARLFFLDLFRNDLPLATALNADYTFANEALASHYGIAGVKGSQMRRIKVPIEQRGGVLGMGAFLTKTSAPLRTSPVHRGIWIYEHVLGRKLGEPPPNVPQLSDDEKSESGLTVAQQLERHRQDPACFSCHDKFDPLGVALENFDPVGRWRTSIQGTPVDARGAFASGETVNGFAALRRYVVERQEEFLHTFCRKLVAYALSRPLIPSDKPLIDATFAALKAAGGRPSAAIDHVVLSQQFRYRRDGSPATAAAPSNPVVAPTLARSNQP